MTIELPKAIADYFAADAGRGAEAIAACFTEVAVVRDEGHTYTGPDAIRRWKEESSAKYTSPLSRSLSQARAPRRS